MTSTMPRPSTLKLPPLDLGEETVGQRLARLRKERSLTQVELADAIGLTQGLISDYERGVLRLNADLLARFALALDVSADELLGLKAAKARTPAPQSRRLLRRLLLFEKLPKRDQEALLRTLDGFLAKAG